MNLYFLTTDYESLGVKSMLIITIIALCGVITYLYKQNIKNVKDKDSFYQGVIDEKEKQILDLIKEHKSDVKEASNDYKVLAEKFYSFTQQLKDLMNSGSVK